MTKTIKFLLLLFCLQSCKSQTTQNNKLENNIKKDSIMYPIVTKDFEKFNEFHYNQLFKKDEFNTREYLPNGNFFEMIWVNAGKYTVEHFKGDYFKIIKHFYENNNIKMKGLFFNSVGSRGFQKGTWYEFDEQGNLIKEIDYDKYYKFTFEDILKFCERENIKVDKGPILQSTGFHTRILREYSSISNLSTWTIEWLKESDTIQTIKIDGTTGKVLSRTDGHYINN
jgi:hypothetical protein